MNYQRAAYSDSPVYGSGNSSVYLCVLEKKNLPNIDIKALISKKKVTDALARLELLVERTVAECQRKLLKHQENISKNYERANWNQSVIAFENFQEKVIEALAIVDSNQAYQIEKHWKTYGEIKWRRASIFVRYRHKLQ